MMENIRVVTKMGTAKRRAPTRTAVERAAGMAKNCVVDGICVRDAWCEAEMF